ncbi:MAG TPA: glycosyltransferase family 4 protein [Stellaceae bacterium]|nr:glycosyltransferase family 4 protein [Stellaceae bacterium]
MTETENVPPGASKQPSISRKPVRIAAYTAGRYAPGSRLRVRQYIPRLADFGIEVAEHWPRLGAYPPRNRLLRAPWLIGSLGERLPQIARSWQADVTLLQRELVSTLSTLEGLSKRPRIVDVDDAIHLNRGGRTAQRLAGLADLVIVGNAWLADVWRRWNPAVEILPTGVDTDRYTARPFPEHPVIGWIGIGSNLPYLTAIAPALSEVCRRFPDAVVAVCSDRRPDLPDVPLRFVPWSETVEAEFLASLTIGVMPLADGEWERGKCSFKMLQYMAAGRPCVVSPVGTNRQLLGEAELGLGATSLDEWREALSALLADSCAAARMGTAGRGLAEQRYSVAALSGQLAELLRRVI